MNNEVEITLPKLGESIVGATVVQWLKRVGDHVALDEPLLEVSTDKVNSEIPSPVAGVLKKILAEVDQELEVGAPLAVIQAQERPAEARPSAIAPVASAEAEESEDNKGFLSPAILRMAQEKGIPLETLQKLPGTGQGGRITKKDLEQHLASRTPSAHKTPVPCSAARGVAFSCAEKAAMASTTPKEGIEIIPMTGMRKAIADNMVKSFYEAPHASLVTEVDVTDIMKHIAQEKERFAAKHGVKLTITSFMVHAITAAAKQFPMINSSLEKDKILMKHYVNVGLAVSLEKGLVVPVIKKCHELSLEGIAKAVADLSSRAREGKLKPDDVTEGSITISNFGITGTMIGIPIIRHPEVAIIGIGAIQKRVMVREDDSLAIRHMVHLSLTFDHRIIDGMYGCAFLNAVKQHLEHQR